jgi:hypothetical protein
LGICHAEGTQYAASHHFVAFRIHVAAVGGEFVLHVATVENLAKGFGFAGNIGDFFSMRLELFQMVMKVFSLRFSIRRKVVMIFSLSFPICRRVLIVLSQLFS